MIENSHSVLIDGIRNWDSIGGLSVTETFSEEANNVGKLSPFWAKNFIHFSEKERIVKDLGETSSSLEKVIGNMSHDNSWSKCDE